MKKKFIIIGVVLAILIVLRLLLPGIILHFANRTLSNMEGYFGHIDDIDVALIRGAYKINDIYLNELDTITQKQTSLFKASSIELSVEWKALFHGSIVGELVFDEPTLAFTRKEVEPEDLEKDSTEFKDLLNDFMPLKVNRFEINNGAVRYLDPGSNPPVDIALTNLNALALNLSNSYDSSSRLPAKITADADVYEGRLNLNLKLNPLADEPTFDMNAEVKDVNLVLLNDFFQAYAKIDVNKGVFTLFTEVAADSGRFKGYIKPLIDGLDVLGKEDREDNIFRQLWEGITEAGAEIFENQPRNSVATKIPFEGDLQNPKASIGATIINVLQNAFIRAIQPSIDNEINLQSVDEEDKSEGNFLQRLFGGGKKNKDKD